VKICFIKLRENRIYESRLSHSLKSIASDYIVVDKSTYERYIDKYDWFFVIGCSGTRPIFDKVRGAGKNIAIVDKGYRDGREIRAENNYWRFGVNGFHSYNYVAKNNCPSDRFERWGLELKLDEEYWDFPSDGHDIYYSGSQKLYDWHKLNKSVTAYDGEILRRIRESTKDKIIYLSKNPNKLKVKSTINNITIDSGEKYSDYLINCKSVITYCSNCVVQSIAKGIITGILGNHPLKPITEPDFNISDKPRLFNNLAYCQWKFSELNSQEFINYIERAAL
jgi:hypothetical protein